MEDLLKTAINAPTGPLLLVAGIAFLAFASIGNVDRRFEPGPSGRIGAAAIGVILLLIGLVLQGPPRSPPEVATYFEFANHKLDTAELRQAFGRPHHSSGVGKNGEHWSTAVTAEGNVTVSFPYSSDSGHSVIKDNQICIRWNSTGKEICYHYARLADDRFVVYSPSGEFESTFTTTYP